MPFESAGETADIHFYGRSTQTGVVARRTIRDRKGRVAREVYYHSAVPDRVALTERDLSLRSVSVYYYDASGRVDHIDEWPAGSRKPRVEHNAYDSSGELTRKWFVEADGVKRYEMRFRDEGKFADLYFDETGAYLTALEGHLVGDVNLPHGWGTTSHGMACGITLSTERGRFDRIAIWVNIKNVAPESLMLHNLVEPTFELRDGGGNPIPLREIGSGRKIDKDHPSLNGQLLDESEAGFMDPAYRLADYFDPLPPGKYIIRIRQPVAERDVVLVSNEATFVVQ